jgi:hypothetical protein
VEHETIFVSAKRKENINLIIDSLLHSVEHGAIDSDTGKQCPSPAGLQEALKAVETIEEGFIIVCRAT